MAGFVHILPKIGLKQTSIFESVLSTQTEKVTFKYLTGKKTITNKIEHKLNIKKVHFTTKCIKI